MIYARFRWEWDCRHSLCIADNHQWATSFVRCNCPSSLNSSIQREFRRMKNREHSCMFDILSLDHCREWLREWNLSMCCECTLLGRSLSVRFHPGHHSDSWRYRLVYRGRSTTSSRGVSRWAWQAIFLVSYSTGFVEKYLCVEQLIVVVILNLPTAGDHFVDVWGIADETTWIEETLLVVLDQWVIVL